MQVAKYPIIGINTDDDDANLKPGWFREIWNALPKNGYSKTGAQNIKGTTVRTNGSIAAGTNTCIGAFADRSNNRILYHLHNSNNDHSVWYFDPLLNTHTLVLQTSYLNYSTSFPITSCDFIEDIANWCDNNNEDRSVVVSRAVAGLYTFNSQASFEKQLSLYKTRHSDPPTAVRFNSAGIPNNISSHSYQFCVQFVYYDNTVSLISPLSQVDIAEVYPIGTSVATKIAVGITVDADIYGVIKKIYWIYVRNDDGNFNLFKETDLDTADPSRSNPNHSIDFFGTEPIQTIFPSQVNFIPNKSKNIVIHDQRAITTLNEFDYEGSEVTLTLATQALGGIASTQFATKICAPNSSYTVGFLYFDRLGRTPGITAQETIYTPNIKKALKLTFDDQNTIIFSDQLRILCTPSGTAPSWATKYAIALKPNNTLQAAYSCLAFPMFYKRDGTDRAASEIEDNGKIFYESPRNSWTKNLYWKLPVNMPFALDGSYKMRLLNNIGQTKEIEDVIEIVGDKIITENFGITNWLTLLGANKGMVNVIFERYKDVQDEVFFEVGAMQDCVGGDPITGSHTLNGDFYYMLSKLVFERVTAGNVTYGGAFGNVLENSTDSGEQIEVPIISQSPTHSNVVIGDVQERVEKKRGRKFLRNVFKGLAGIGSVLTFVPGAQAVGAGLSAAGSIGGTELSDKPDEEITQIETVKLVYSPDYTKICSDSGLAWIDVKNKKISSEPNTLSISDPYIINSKINGLSDFRTLYQIPISRSPIRKMISVGASNILLAIHERTTTSLATYAGGKMLNTTDGSQILGEGDHIVGYNNELSGGYGTIYPDSVVSHKGRAWWFDPFSGEVVRYANNGLTPIGSIYKMHNFFREKGDQFRDPTGRNVIAGYDGNLDILYLTFKSSQISGILVTYNDFTQSWSNDGQVTQSDWTFAASYMENDVTAFGTKKASHAFTFIAGRTYKVRAIFTTLVVSGTPEFNLYVFNGSQQEGPIGGPIYTSDSWDVELEFLATENSNAIDFSSLDTSIFGGTMRVNITTIIVYGAEEITVAFIDRQGEERWICFTDFSPERYAYINEKLYGFLNGVLWEFNSNNTRNLFFGAQYTTRLRHLFNAEFSREKRLLNIGVESNKKWVFDPITVAKFGVDQETSLAKSNFIRRDDVFYSDVKRDKNTATGLLPTGKSALVAGQPMIGKVYDVTLENDDTELVELDFLNYGFEPQPGHNIV